MAFFVPEARVKPWILMLMLMALSCIPVQGHQVEPDSTWWVSPDTLCWTPVEGAEGYRVYQELLVIPSVTPVGGGPPVLYWWVWAIVGAGENCASVGQDARRGSPGPSPWDSIPYDVDALHGHATAAKRRTWGAIKNPRRARQPPQ